jgi:hypothetical protein
MIRAVDVRLLSPKHHILNQNRNRRNENDVYRQTTPHAYREDTSKKNQGWAFLDGGSTPLEPDDNGPTTTAVATSAASEDNGTYKTPCK